MMIHVSAWPSQDCFDLFNQSVIINRKSGNNKWTERMIIIDVSVHMISRMEEYIIPYLLDKSSRRSEFDSGFKSYDFQLGFEVILNNSFRLIQVGDCWINV